MFRRSPKSTQLDMFTSSVNMFKGKTLKQFESKESWHNQFRKEVTNRINEDLFKVLYAKGKGSPNASIRIMVAMMILKEGEGISDEKIFESARFNILTRSALGLENLDAEIPTESTYYLFRKNVNEYAKEKGENLFTSVFKDITKEQSIKFNVSGKRIRMDSKLIGSNIAWLSRYELVHETIRVYYKECLKGNYLDDATKSQLSEILKIKGNKIVYTSTSTELKKKLKELGSLMYSLKNNTLHDKIDFKDTFLRVFEEQFEVGDDKIVIARDKQKISAKSVQSPHDPDSTYRNKDGNKKKGFAVNLTESCDDQGLNLIGDVDVKEITSSDVDFFQDGVERASETFKDKAKDVHADGAYHSPDNQDYCKLEKINLYLHAIQGAKGRYELELKDGTLSVLDTKTAQQLDCKKIVTKNNEIKWRIKTEKAYRYFTQKQIDTSELRKKIANTPLEILQKRNNVEASIFQLAYHFPNAKTIYRGLEKHQMWANMRSLWVNFVRIMNYNAVLGLKGLFFNFFNHFLAFFSLFLALEAIFFLKKKNIHLTII